MFSFLPPTITGCLTLSLLVGNLLLWALPVYILIFFKLLSPFQSWRKFSSKLIVSCAEYWSVFNKVIFKLTLKIEWEIRGDMDLAQNESYIVNCNHQSWTDILVLMNTFNRQIPFLRFFLKQELIKVPIIGLIWWALDYPFMKRYSKETLKKYPELRGKDLETTKKACQKYEHVPVSIINFLEGTRYTVKKHLMQKSPYKHLLKPKSGGIAFIIASMREKINSMLNITLIYPNSNTSFWSFISGKIQKIIINVEKININSEFFSGNYMDDPVYREKFQGWVRELWEKKDNLIVSVLQETNPSDTIDIQAN